MGLRDHSKEYTNPSKDPYTPKDYPDANDIADGEHIVEIIGVRVSDELEWLAVDGRVHESSDLYVGAKTNDFMSFKTQESGDINARRLRHLNNLIGLDISPVDIANNPDIVRAYEGCILRGKLYTSAKGGKTYKNWEWSECISGSNTMRGSQDDDFDDGLDQDPFKEGDQDD